VLLCERAGVVNLGIEGIMVAGAFAGWFTVHAGAGLWTGVAVAALVWVAVVLFVLVTPGDATVPTLIVIGLILAGGVYFAYMMIFNRAVLDIEPGDDIFAATPEVMT